MDYIYSIILGVVQGVTEFWPVSSSGHLVVAHDVFSFDFVDNLSFDVALHLGTLLALILFFAKDIYKIILSFFSSFANWNLKNDVNQRMAWYILVGTIPAAVIGFIISDLAETVFRNLWLVAGLLIGVGILFIVFEKYAKQQKNIEELSWGGSIVVAIAQVLALVPGVSRSGITILAGLSQGLKRAAAARYSFLLSAPVVFGAGAKKMLELGQEGLSGDQWLTMAIGFIASAGIGYLAVKFLLKYLENEPLNIFAYYRFILGGIIIIYMIVR